jgi:hypothetical protein
MEERVGERRPILIGFPSPQLVPRRERMENLMQP